MPNPPSASVPSGAAAFNAPRSDVASAPQFDPSGRFLHRCAHPGCTAWGAFGFGVDFRRYRQAVARGDQDARRWLGRWYCAAHRPPAEAVPPKGLPPAPGNRASDPTQQRTSRQGRLL